MTPGLLAPPQPTLAWGSLQLPSRYLLAPLAGYTNLAFRQAVRELGGLGLATTDLVNARSLVSGSPKARDLVRTCPTDRPVAAQIYGAEAEWMCPAAQWLEDYGVSSIDINMGCPVHKVVRGGGGSALMCDADRSVALVRSIVEAVSIPVTVKMRLGWDEETLSAPYFARAFEQAGVAAITIHGRTRAQGFSGRVNRDGIRAVVEAVERIPVIGNGDVRTVADAQEMMANTGCAGVAIGRGALLNPWLFAQLRRWETTGDPGPSGTWADHVRFLARHFALQVEERGERVGCLTFRKVARWYCRVLKPGRELHRRLMLISSVAEFADILGDLQRRPEYARNEACLTSAELIATPSGPNERW